jgi:hypothetical protein
MTDEVAIRVKDADVGRGVFGKPLLAARLAEQVPGLEYRRLPIRLVVEQRDG